MPAIALQFFQKTSSDILQMALQVFHTYVHALFVYVFTLYTYVAVAIHLVLNMLRNFMIPSLFSTLILYDYSPNCTYNTEFRSELTFWHF